MSTITSREEATEARAPAERGDSAAARVRQREASSQQVGFCTPSSSAVGRGRRMLARPAPRMRNNMAELMVGIGVPSSPPRVPLLVGSLAERSPERTTIA